MSKFKKIMAGIGLCTAIAGVGLSTTGCADMTESQIEEAMDTATEAEKTFEELKDLLEKQNADYNTHMTNYEELLEEKNETIEGLIAELDEFQEIMKNNNESVSNTEAQKLLYSAYMRQYLLTKETNNMIIEIKQDSDTVNHVIKSYRTSDNKFLLSYDQITGTTTSSGLYYGDNSGYNALVGTSLSTANSGIYTIRRQFVLSFFENIKATDICQAEKLQDGGYRIVAIVNDESGTDFNIVNMYTIILDSEGRFASVDRDYMTKDKDTPSSYYVNHISYEYSYGELTEGWAEEKIDYITNYEEPTV